MPLTPEEQSRANELALQFAMIELVRLAIAEVAFSADREVFLRRLRALEETAVASLSGRTFWPQASPEANFHVGEVASGIVSRLFASIRHPSDDSGGERP